MVAHERLPRGVEIDEPVFVGVPKTLNAELIFAQIIIYILKGNKICHLCLPPTGPVEHIVEANKKEPAPALLSAGGVENLAFRRGREDPVPAGTRTQRGKPRPGAVGSAVAR